MAYNTNGVQSLIGDVKSDFGNKITNGWESISSVVSGIADNIGTWAANLWAGEFVGVSNFDDLKVAVQNYSDKVQEVVNQYDVTANLEGTFKGQASDALSGFVEATKHLLDAYVEFLKNWNEELTVIYEKYTSGDQSLSQNVSSDSEQVEKIAQNIQLG